MNEIDPKELEKIFDVFPQAQIEKDLHNQIVIYTGVYDND
tara:strand:- start:1488 stop:1607 length:120 start_codon:yes stop_codon:yes gene_type:complete